MIALGIGIVGAAGAPAASADQSLVLPTASLQGLHSARASLRSARADLAAGLPKRLASSVSEAATQTAAAAGSGLRLRSDAFVFGSPTTARAVLAAWRGLHRARRAAVGGGGYAYARGSLAVIAWRDADRVGVVSVRGNDAPSLAAQYAVLADQWLRIPPPATALGKVLEQIRPDGTLSKQTALQAFAVAFGPLPGVTVPSGKRSVIPSGTEIALWVEHYAPQLTGRQRRVVDERLGIPPPGSAYVADYGDPGFHPNAVLQGWADGWAKDYTALLGHTLALKIVAGDTTTYVPPKKGTGVVLADTVPFKLKGNTSGLPDICRIRMTQDGLAYPTAERKFTIAHEVFHCFQEDLRGQDAWNPPPLWVAEGTADWAAATVDPGPWDPVGFQPGWLELDKYLANPAQPLFERSYDASGFWGHLEDVTFDVWKVLPAVITAGSSDAAFKASGADDGAVLTSWASSMVRPSGGDGGRPWHMFSPTQPPDDPTVTTPVAALAGDGKVSAPPYTLSNYKLHDVPNMPLVNVAIDGWARLSTKFNYTVLSDNWFCIEGQDCTCPEGSTGTVPDYLPLDSDAYLAVTGDPDGGAGSSGHVTYHSLDEFCKQPPPPPGGGGGGTGGSFGDPYISTFDGGHADATGYGFQTTGEFTLVKSTVDNLEIQARLQPFPSVFGTSQLAMNTAFAMRDGGAVVEVDNPTSDIGQPGALVLYLDHQRVTARSGEVRSLAGGGRVRYTPATVTVTWPDGTVADVYRLLIHYGVNISVKPSRRRAGQLTGLFGNDNGNARDDYVGRNGVNYAPKVIQGFDLYAGSPAAQHVVLDEFGASWRITPATSLFVYPPGKNTYSYIVKGFPLHPFSAQSLSRRARAAALAACHLAHVTNAALLAGCIVDVGATGKRALAASAGAFQHAAGLPPTAPRNLAGRWSGSYSGAFNGTFTLHWTQVGAALRGTISLSNPHDTLPIRGTVGANGIKFGSVGFAIYSGAVSGDFMSGSYSTPRGGGSWSATKAG